MFKIINALILALCFRLSISHAYVFSLSNEGSEIYWKNTKNVYYYIHSPNTLNLDAATILSIAGGSISQWNSATALNLHLNTGDGNKSSRRNDIFFSNSDIYFSGEGVVGVTLIAFEESTGGLVEADIILNEKFSLSENTNESYYIGDILTHELGHSLGFAHSEVMHSTMFFKLTNGQDTLAGDDKAAVYARYDSPLNTKGKITGKVVGKNTDIGIFGTHLQAISLTTGKVEAAALSKTDGSFSIDGLDSNDEYFIYSSPNHLKDYLPNYFFSSNNNFCPNNKNYVGSFFQTCLNSDEGYPRSVNFSNGNNNDIGNLTIRCSMDSPIRYLLAKGGGEFDIPMENENFETGLGNSFVGFFSLSEVINNESDNINIDLSSYDFQEVAEGENLYLEIKIITQPFYSLLKTVTNVTFTDYGYSSYPSTVEVDEDGNPLLDYTIRLPLSVGKSNDNIFKLNIVPYNFADIQVKGLDLDNDDIDDTIFGFVNSTGYDIKDFFPEYDKIEEARFFYLFTSHIVKRNALGNYEKFLSKEYVEFDNSHCVDAPNSVALNSLSSKTQSESESEQKNNDHQSPFACGSIDITPSGGGGGVALFSFFFGLIVILLSFPRRLF